MKMVVAIHSSLIHAIATLLIFHQITIQVGFTLAKSPIQNTVQVTRYSRTTNDQKLQRLPVPNYVMNSCKTTLYPKLCYKSLSIFSSRIRKSPRLMAQVALAFALSTTRKTSIKMKTLSRNRALKPREKAAMVDCLEELSDSIYELEISMKEMWRARSRSGPNFDLMMNDIQTWVSAALTDEDTCMDEFSGNDMNGEVKVVVKGLVLKVAQLTSVALALVNHYATS